jgi:hypothetical protein
VDSVLREWPRIRREIDAGSPAVVGLVRTAGWSPWRLTTNHQVLAWAYEAREGAITIRVYDPNHPRRDDVTLEITLDATPAAGPGGGRPWRDRIGLRQSTGEPLLGFFRQPYPRPRSLRSWRSA